MPNAIDASTFRVLHPNGKTVGTGFLVSPNLAVTCAHVVLSADAFEGDTIEVQFSGRADKISALVESQYWRDVDQGDIAFLRLDSTPDGIQPLRLASSVSCRPGSEFRSFGYATAADVQGIHANGKIDGYLPQYKLLQLQAPQANHGISGAPVLDEKRGVVVGMITKGHTELGRNELTTFAAPTELLWELCPSIKPPTPILPYRNPIVEGINLLPYDYDQRIQNFLTEYLGTDSHPVPFGGRYDALKMLNTWQAAETTPYLLLAAPAGRGKSALLVCWLDSLKERDDLALAFVPVSIRFGTNMERVFYAALAARLAFLHGDDVPASPETSTAVYRGLVADYLSKPLANGRTLLVVLDGLDETADWQAGADFMPGELPAGVRVVVSARFLAGDADSTPWLRRLNWERNSQASAPPLPPLDRAGVADVLLKMGCPLDELSRKVDIVTELYRLSAGDPLLVGLYVGDLWAKGKEVTHLKLEDLAGIQPGYKGYFDCWWEDQEKLWAADTPLMRPNVQLALNLLACALSSLTREDLVRLAPKELNRHTLDNAFKALQRFVIGDGVYQGYTFSHSKLGQYFWDALTKTEQKEVEERFLGWCERTFQEFINGMRDPKKKAEVPVYVVRNYGTHLLKSEQPIEKWLPLIHHQQWAQAWFTVEGAYGGYMQDVQRVWKRCWALDQQIVDTAGNALYLGWQIRCGLIESSVHSLAGNIPPQLVWLLVREEIWTLPQTWLFIRQMPESEHQFCAITALLPYLGDNQLPEALEAARAIKDGTYRISALSILVQRMPELTGEVLDMVRAIPDEKSRANILGILAQYLPEDILGQLRKMAQKLQDKKYRKYVMSELNRQKTKTPRGAPEILQITKKEYAVAIGDIVTNLSAEQLQQVLRAMQPTSDQRHRISLDSSLDDFLPENLWEEVSLDLAREEEDKNVRTNLLSFLVQQKPEAVGKVLLSAAQALRSGRDCADLLIASVNFMPDGQLDRVLDVARMMSDGVDRAYALSALAQRRPDVAKEALDAAQTIGDDHDRAVIFCALGEFLPEEHLEQLLKVVPAIRDEGGRFLVLHTLAKHLSEEKLVLIVNLVKELDRNAQHRMFDTLAKRLPKRYLDKILTAAQTSFGWQRDELMGTLAQVVTEDQLEEVVKLAAESGSDWRDNAGVLNILTHRMQEGQLEKMLETAESIRNEDVRTKFLIALARRLLHEKLRQVLDAARRLKDEWNRAVVLGTLAQYLPAVSGEALEVVRKIQSEGKRTSALSELAQLLPKEHLKLVLEAAREIEDGGERARILSELAKRMPEVSKEALEAALSVKERRYQYNVFRGLRSAGLAKYLSINQLEQLLEEGLSIWPNVICSELGKTLAQKMPEEQLAQVLKAIKAITFEPDYAEALCILAQRMPEYELVQVLEAARIINNQEERARVLGILSKRMHEVSGEALPVAWTVDLLAELAQYIPEAHGKTLEAAQSFPEDSEKAFRVAQIIDDKWERSKQFSGLIQPMKHIDIKTCMNFLERSLFKLADRTRADIFSDISALMPVLIHIGAPDTPREIYEAVCDVTTWWP